jgi:lipopolysaccharide transport system permease protein
MPRVVMQKPSIVGSSCCKDGRDDFAMRNDMIKEIWRYRELLYFLAWRDIKVRYRQAFLGVAWAVIQPLFNMIIFTLLFGRLAHMPSDGIPYPLFCYCALVPWTYFSAVLGPASLSLVNNGSIIEKIYFPRVLLPTGTALAGLVDFGISALLLVGLILYYHVRLTAALLFIPIIVLIMIILTAGMGMLTAALNVRYRDVKYALPFLIQIWMYATPIIYPDTMVPARFRTLLALNPCWGLVSAFRSCFLPGTPVNFQLMGISFAVTITLFLCGSYYFRKAERSFVDLL